MMALMKLPNASPVVWSLSTFVGGVLALGMLLPSFDDLFFMISIGVPFLVVGTLVARRRPDNPVGWLFLGFAAVAAVAFTGSRYWASGPTGPGSRPAAAVAASLAVHLWHPGFAFFILGFLLFPDGRLLSRRWTVAAWVTAALGVVGVASGMLEHAFYADVIGGDVLPAPLLTGPVADAAGAIFSFCVIALVGMLAVSALCIFLRFRRSTGVVRQQMKWVVLAVVVFAVALPASLVLAGEALGVWALPLIPVSAGVAILRHRLFDIDVIINRALVYGVLTAVLATVYLGGIIGLGAILRTVTHEDSSLAVATSTLAVAGLFGPLRRRVQASIDRRFYRSKYDAEQIIATFSTRLRDEVDITRLNTELLDAVNATVRPAGASLWLRP